MLSKLARSLRPKAGTRAFSMAPHGSTGTLMNRVLAKGTPEYEEAWALGSDAFEMNLNHRQTCDIELLLNGGFSPLQGFMTEAEYKGVVHDMHLPDGTIFPMPITFDVSAQQARELEQSGKRHVLLRDGEYNPIALLDVEDIYTPNKAEEGEAVFGGDPEHPAVAYLAQTAGDVNIGGRLRGFQLPPHYDHKDLRRTPEELRATFAERGWDKVVAFQTRNPMHRAHFELTMRALESEPDMHLLVHPVVGMTKPGDIDHHTRVKCIRNIMPKYPEGRADLAVFPLAMRMGGPREAIWHCIIRKNYGVTHFILGRDHAGPGSNSAGEDFYGPYDARDAAVAHQEELGINTLSFEMMMYSPDDNKYYAQDEVPEGTKLLKLSGTEVRRRLVTGEPIPEWFSFGDVVKILRQAHPPRHKQGVTIFFTGLSGSGKSTIANALREKLMEVQERRVAMLDGDYVRKLISSELGFSEEHRNLNIKRIGYISSLIANAGGIVIAAPIAPYKESRDWSRDQCQQVGGFCEVHIATPITTCRTRDRKGLYQLSDEGKLKGLTGLSDQGEARYDTPTNAELVIDTTDVSVEAAVDKVMDWLTSEGYVVLDDAHKQQEKAL